MGWDVAFQGLGAGIQGGLDAYSWQKEHKLRDRQLDQEDEMIGLRREQIRAEIDAMLARVNAPQEDSLEGIDTVDESGNPIRQYVPRSQLSGRSFPKHQEPKTSTPEPVMSIDTMDDQGRPVTQVLPRSAASGRTFPKYQAPKPMTAVSRDDPSLPRGVRQYLAGFGGRYRNRWAAKRELDGVLEKLYKDHPDLDASKVYQMFDRMFPTRDQDDGPLLDSEEVPGPPGLTMETRTGEEQPAPTPLPMAPDRQVRPTPLTFGARAGNVGQPPITRSGTGRASGAGRAGGPSAIPPTMQVGSVVELRDGRRIRVRTINPDGTFDGAPVQ